MNSQIYNQGGKESGSLPKSPPPIHQKPKNNDNNKKKKIVEKTQKYRKYDALIHWKRGKVFGR